MNHFKLLGRYMMAAAEAHARWEIDVARTILGDKKRLIILGLLIVPIFAVSFATRRLPIA